MAEPQTKQPFQRVGSGLLGGRSGVIGGDADQNVFPNAFFQADSGHRIAQDLLKMNLFRPIP